MVGEVVCEHIHIIKNAIVIRVQERHVNRAVATPSHVRSNLIALAEIQFLWSPSPGDACGVRIISWLVRSIHIF
jgi:hypothetical protein